ncbi:MAG: hypothetical protein AAGJ46_14705 [Planctomycetota bacterium]
MATKKTKKLGHGVQSLEQKAMMAGDIAIQMIGNDLHINEAFGDAGEDQQVQIYSLGNNRIRVQGLGETDIAQASGNGWMQMGASDYIDLTVTGDINVNLGEGNDSLTMPSWNGGVRADQLTVNMGGGADRVSLTGVTTRQELHVNTGAGNDDVTVSSATVGDSSWEDLEIRTGSGADSVRVLGSNVRDDVIVEMYENVWENDADRLTVGSNTAKDIKADMGNGRDTASITSNDIRYNIDLDLGYDHGDNNDNDYAYLGHNDVDGRVDIDGDDGNDVVRAAFNDVEGEFEFNGDSGTDYFYAWFASQGQDSNDVGNYDINSAGFRTYGYA